MAPFCVGSGISMGSNGLHWAGDNPQDDCAMLWTQLLGVTSVGRAVVACAAVFLMALLAQFLTSRSSNRIQNAKEHARQQRMARFSATGLTTQLCDPEQGHTKTANANTHTTHDNDSNSSSSSSAPSHYPIGYSAVPATVTSVSIASRTVPMPASALPLGSSMAIPATTGSLRSSRPAPTRTAASLVAPPSLPLQLRVGSVPSTSVAATAKVSNSTHLCDSLQHGLRIFIAYLLMLAAMTYDVALLGGIISGFTLGYFVFASDTSKVPTSADPCCS